MQPCPAFTRTPPSCPASGRTCIPNQGSVAGPGLLLPQDRERARPTSHKHLFTTHRRMKGLLKFCWPVTTGHTLLIFSITLRNISRSSRAFLRCLTLSRGMEMCCKGAVPSGGRHSTGLICHYFRLLPIKLEINYVNPNKNLTSQSKILFRQKIHAVSLF